MTRVLPVLGASAALAVSGLAVAAAEPAADTGTIAGLAWFDRDGNGKQDNGEPGYTSGRITIIPENHPEQAVDAHPGPDGKYRQDKLAPGFYDVYANTSAYRRTTAAELRVQVVAGRTAPADFGVQGGVISGTAWTDANGDGTRQDTESPMIHAAIGVTGTDADQQQHDQELYTDAQGRYQLDDVPLGSYRAHAVPPNGSADQQAGLTEPGKGGDRTRDSDFDRISERSAAFDVASTGGGVSPVELDAGFVPAKADLVTEKIEVGSPHGGAPKVGDTATVKVTVNSHSNVATRFDTDIQLPEGMTLQSVSATPVDVIVEPAAHHTRALARTSVLSDAPDVITVTVHVDKAGKGEIRATVGSQYTDVKPDDNSKTVPVATTG